MIALFVALAFLAPATFACLFYVVLTYLGRRRAIAIPLEPQTAFVVLIPAHNEALSITETLRSVLDADYPAALRRVVVVADNCTDRTADVVREHGAEVLERHDLTLRGKGYALAYALETILPGRPDAVIVLDADCEVCPQLFRTFDAHLAAGCRAVQSAVLTRNPDAGPSGFASAVGNQMDNDTAAGKDRLGLRPPLRGNGMAFRRELLECIPWRSYGLTEDAEYDDRLKAAGVRVQFAGTVHVRSEAPVRTQDLCQQRRRWRAALFVGRGLFTNWVESKPVVLAQLAITTVVVPFAAPQFIAWVAVLWLLTVIIYLRAAWCVGLTRSRGMMLLRMPWLIVRLLFVTIGGFSRGNSTWIRTRRSGELLLAEDVRK